MITSAGASRVTSLNTYVVDPVHSCVQFRVRHLGFSRITGRFDTFSAVLRMNPVSLGSLAVEARIDAASVNTGDAVRDAHLRSADFFEADRYPEILFKSTRTRDVRVDALVLCGRLTLHGITRPVELAVTYLGEARDLDGRERIAFEAHTRINRKDFGLTWNSVLETGGLLVGEDVEVMLAVQAVRTAG
ncbi:YceI family protein [Rhodocaloribacter litoris]|uniref:YceI family protein n=1 Tax=Rhodocaloribacter litoris TaxID=2558931 RepID=UPI0014245599|nr:YceI family protein [Rhodocaloribacter litoris]QXD16398.1 YceI family protein [Rhodocaloribacter litoris]